MREGDDCRVVIIRCVDGENRLSDYIEWSENLLSDENFEIVLGEGYSGRVSVNIAKFRICLSVVQQVRARAFYSNLF